MTDENGSPPPERESIWSISPGWRNAYFILFVIQNIAGISLLCWYEIFRHTSDDAIRTILNITHGSGQTALGSAGTTLTITEAGRLIMVLGEQLQRWFEKREDARVARRVDEEVAKVVDEAVAQAVDQAVAQAVAQAVDQAVAQATDEGRVEGRGEGRVEAHRQWTEWLRRKMEAESNGEPFDDPPPDIDSNDTDNGSPI